MNPYGDTIGDHSKHPRNYGSLENPDIRAEDVNPFCGDRVRIEIAIVDGIVAAARFQGDLCMIAKAASSLLTEMMIGSNVDDLAAFNEERLLRALDAQIQPARKKCALLPLTTMQSGVTAYSERRATS